MQMYPELFHPHRLNDPFRQAERRVFRALARSEIPGFAYYEWQRNRRDSQALQLDFAVWVQGVGRFGLQVKGGLHKFEKGGWYRRKGRRGDYEKVNGCPLAITADATMSLLKEISEELHKSTFFVPVLVLPDMEPDDAIIKRLLRSNVYVIWGADRLVDHLAAIAREVEVRRPPDAHDIKMEVAVITDGQIDYDGAQAATGGGPDAGGNTAGPVADLAGPDLAIPHLRRVQVNLAPGQGNGERNREVRNM